MITASQPSLILGQHFIHMVTMDLQRPNTDMVHDINDRYYCEPLPCVSSYVSKVTNPPEVKIINPKSPSTKSEADSQQTKKKSTTVTTTIEEKLKILSYLNNYGLLVR